MANSIGSIGSPGEGLDGMLVVDNVGFQGGGTQHSEESLSHRSHPSYRSYPMEDFRLEPDGHSEEKNSSSPGGSSHGLSEFRGDSSQHGTNEEAQTNEESRIYSLEERRSPSS